MNKRIDYRPGDSDERPWGRWTVLATGDGQETIHEANGTAYIPVGAQHRIANVGDDQMRFIEVQTGAILAEDDIHRYEDRYGRDTGDE
jgi:mannose-6-phosphate isomerase-like protein (cupin superfamily)